MRPAAWISRLSCAIGLLALVPAMSVAADTWSLTTADFKTQPVTLQSIDAEAVSFIPAGQAEEQRLPLESFLQLERPAAASPSSSPCVLHLVSGDRIAGKPRSLKNEQLLWENSAVGQVSVSIRQVRAITRSAAPPLAIDRPLQEDLVQLANRDALRGIVVGLEADQLLVQAGGQQTPVPIDSVAVILFASAGGVIAEPDRGFRLKLADGSSIFASTVALAGGKLEATLADKSVRPLDLAGVSSIEQVNGPVSWLSSRTPSEDVQIPAVGDRKWPTRAYRTVDGQPIRIGSRSYSRGLGVHAYSRLVYPLDGQYKALRTQYAIDGAGRYADVTVRIKLDDRVVHEQTDFRAGVLSPVVVLDLGSARTLTLEVDYGQNNDTQDRFTWIEPALLRHTPPATGPAAMNPQP